MSTPAEVEGVESATEISVGDGYGCALISDGRVLCWGQNWLGRLGNGFLYDSNPGMGAAAVVGIDNAVSVATGFRHACAALATGKVKCWGYNDWGQLGNNTRVESAVPVESVGLTGAQSVFAVGDSTCAVKTTGALSCWGKTYEHALSTAMRLTPAATGIGSGVVEPLLSNGGQICALMVDAKVKCLQQFNADTLTFQIVEAAGFANAKDVIAGSSRESTPLRLYAVLADGSVAASYPFAPGSQLLPVSGLNGIASLFGDSYIPCSVSTTGGVMCQLLPVPRIDGTPMVPAAATDISIDNTVPDMASLTWTAPDGDGHEIDKYRVITSTYTGEESVLETETASAEVGGLKAFEEYTFRIQAHSAMGWGAVAQKSLMTAVTASMALSTVNFSEVTTTGFKVSWTAADAAVNPVDKYRVVWRKPKAVIGEAEVTESFAVVSGLKPGNGYIVDIYAHNAAGWGVPSEDNVVQLLGRPAAPSNLRVANATASSLQISWNAVVNPPAPVTGYVLDVVNEGLGFVKSVELSATTATVSGLSANTRYQVSVYAVGDGVVGSASAPIEALTSAGAPAAVTSVKAVFSPKRMDLSWPAALSNGATVKKYEVRSRLKGSAWKSWTATGLTRKAKLTGVAKGKTYEVQIRATNAKGSTMSRVFSFKQVK